MPLDLSPRIRFLASLATAALVFVVAAAMGGFVGTRIGGGTGFALGLVSGASLAFALVLGYWVLVDWLNLRVIRRSVADGSALPDDAIVAFEGVVRVDGPPMTAPFSGTPAAAYTYVVAHSSYSPAGGRRRRFVLMQGFHMRPTRIEGTGQVLRLRTFPGFEDDLRENRSGREWGRQAVDLAATLGDRATNAGQAERESRLLEVRHTENDDVHHDYRMADVDTPLPGFAIDEEVLPANARVCVIATHDHSTRSLTGRRPRIGPNVMVYRGSRDEVLARVAADLRWFAWAIAALLTAAWAPAAVAFAFY